MSQPENRNTFYRIFQGAPIQFHWQGWRTTSHALDRMGWEIVASEIMDEYTRQIIIKLGATSPDKKLLIAGSLWINPHDIMPCSYSQFLPCGFLEGQRPFEMQQYSANDVFYANSVELTNMKGLMGLRKIDPYTATDIRAEELYRQMRIGELKIFKDAIEPEVREIFIPLDSVDECLNRALKLQFHDQQRMQKELLLPQQKPLIQAKVFSLVA